MGISRDDAQAKFLQFYMKEVGRGKGGVAVQCRCQRALPAGSQLAPLVLPPNMPMAAQLLMPA
jgi:hypothetical protein